RTAQPVCPARDQHVPVAGRAAAEGCRRCQDCPDPRERAGEAAMDRVERRDPNKVYHKMTTAQLQQLSPAFTWKEYFVTIASPSFDSLDVSVPDFVKGMNQLVATSNLEDIKTYL